MIFLVHYDCPTSTLIEFLRFDDAQRDAAQARELALTLEHSRLGLLNQREVVILGAESEEVVRRSHSRYFLSLEELVLQFEQALNEAVECVQSLRKKSERAQE